MDEDGRGRLRPEGGEADGRDADAEAQKTALQPTVANARARAGGRDGAGEGSLPRPEDGLVARAGAGAARAGALLAAHRLAALLTGAAIALLVVVGTLLSPVMAGTPDATRVRADALAHTPVPTHDGGPWNHDGVLIATDAQLREKSTEASGGISARTTVTYSDGSVEASWDAILLYQRSDGSWELESIDVPQAASWRPTSGPDQQKLLASLEALLTRAEARLDSRGDDGEESLANLYRDCEASVTNDELDVAARLDKMTVRCSKQEGFASRNCDLSLTLRFVTASGVWELTDVSVSDGAKELGYEPLKGSWSGSFRTQSSSGHKCLSGRDAGLRLSIDEVATSGDTTMIAGTLDGVAHFHPEPERDSTGCDGDSALESLAFTGTLQDGSDGLVFDCETADDVRGSVSLRLEFGNAQNPSAATATLVSTHDYQDSFLLVPYQRTARYEDEFVLRKV
nr:hypothetical protein [uncultured Olsenella sp.]